MMKTSFSYLNYLRPNLYLKSINDINIYALKRSGIKYVFIDLDNTLVPHFTKLPNSSSIKFVNELKANGMKVIICSNNSKKRVEQFCNLIDVDDFIYNSQKPFVRKIKKMIKKYDIHPEDSLMIGDQFITDVWVANRLGFKSILVLPIIDSNRNQDKQSSNFIISIIEKLIYKYIAHTNFLENQDATFIKDNYDYI